MKNHQLIKNKKIGDRGIRTPDGLIIEKDQPEKYRKLRIKITRNRYARERNQILRDLCGTSARQARIDMGM